MSASLDSRSGLNVGWFKLATDIFMGTCKAEA